MKAVTISWVDADGISREYELRMSRGSTKISVGFENCPDPDQRDGHVQVVFPGCSDPYVYLCDDEDVEVGDYVVAPPSSRCRRPIVVRVVAIGKGGFESPVFKRVIKAPS